MPRKRVVHRKEQIILQVSLSTMEHLPSLFFHTHVYSRSRRQFFWGGGSSEVSDKLVDMMEGWAAKERETYLSRNAETKSELKGLWMLETQALTKPGIKAKKWSISLHVTNWKHASSCILIFLTQHCSLQFHLLRARDRKAFFGAFCKCLV